MSEPLRILQDVTKRLESAGIEYFLVGSMASMQYSRPRFTNDIDLVAQISPQHVLSFFSLFPLSEYYCPPKEVLQDEVARGGMFNILHQESGIKVDFMVLKKTAFDESRMQRRRKMKVAPDFDLFVASPEDVIIKKLEYFREGESEKHLTDIRAILSETEVDQAYLKKWIAHFGLEKVWSKIS